MKKRIRIPIIIVTILILVGAGLAGLVYFETRKMTTMDTQQVVPGLYAVKDGYVNFYLIQGQDTYIAVDAGMDPDRIRRELERLDIDPEQVGAVFLTHSDVDHIGGLSVFPRAKIYLPAQEEQMINGQTPRFLFTRNKLAHPHELIGDNQVIEVGDHRVRAILTPGHTPGSTCFLINDTYLFTGDSMSLIDGEVREFNELFNMDTQTQRVSLGKLSGFSPAALMFTAHYGGTDKVNQAFARWKK